ncbi:MULTISPECIES: hypothetical protein [Streptomyces]|uniref:hypothetical protein n=1 Tax=Streptomyces TaxID=1883 RepID=UPI00163BDBF3|nr:MULTISPECIES: hypothetical protein [Streptomyces]MBC2877432.1 hypothetical protein [Streptomyces sp. TYQ1024]UBI38230.1 hypothetical protein K7I03_18410 [Streptomyces mobaraensis]UKW30816.1 hypothetical protein MCU78_18370 [Streptomyces sp. TYQ1024]
MAAIPLDLLDRIRTLEKQVRAVMGSANTRPAATPATAAPGFRPAPGTGSVPWPLPLPQPADGWRPAEGPEWTVLFTGRALVHHPRVRCLVDVITEAEADGTPPRAEIRLLVDGVPAVSAPAVTGTVDLDAPVGVPPGAPAAFALQGRLTGGSGRLLCVPRAFYGTTGP